MANALICNILLKLKRKVCKKQHKIWSTLKYGNLSNYKTFNGIMEKHQSIYGDYRNMKIYGKALFNSTQLSNFTQLDSYTSSFN